MVQIMLSFEEILLRLDNEIEVLNLRCHPQTLSDPIEYILSLGGKRIRPALALMACNLYTEDIESIIKPALGMEVFHNFTLLHDDLMDKAILRRNKPTVHKLWSDNAAILSGDAMLILAYRLIGETDSRNLKQILDLFTQTALEICEGQQYDMEFETRMDVSEEEYLEMIRLKTAVLLACCLKAGAITGGSSGRDAQLLYDFGIHIGLAFQLQDDLLDVFGDPATFGKNIGGDILCNKKTYLLITALKQASGTQKQDMISWINKTEFDPQEKISFFTQLYSEMHLKNLIELKMKKYYEEAFSYLDQLAVGKDRLETLQSVCDSLLYRQY